MLSSSEKNFIPSFKDSGGKKGLTIQQNESTPLLDGIFLYLFTPPKPFWSAESPGEENALSHSLYLLALD